jgi:acetate---CoA ligase (ADP-forming)
VIRAETLDEMFDLAAALDNQPLPLGRRVGIVTNAGGPGILCTDACEAGGLIVPELPETTKSMLRKFLPAASGLSNPVDMIASARAESYQKTIETILTSGEIDSLIVIYIPVDRNDSESVAQAIRDGVANARAAGARQKPVLVCLMTTDGARALIGKNEIVPSYMFPEAAAKVLARAVSYAEWRAKPLALVPEFTDINKDAAKAIVADCLKSRGDGWLTTEECRKLLSAFGIPQAAAGIARTREEAVAIANSLVYPVAAKLASARVLHKSDIGALRLNLENPEAVARAFDAIRQDEMEGILIQKMLTGGVEVMIGITDDPLFGPLIAFGLGGIHVEILADVCFRVTPLTDRDAHEMVRNIRGFRLLEGYRGHAPADISAIEDVLLRISRMVEDIPEIRELDLNPIFAMPPGQDCIAVDARIRVAK